MSQTLFLPIGQVFSNLGALGAGFKLYTFETGTTTPLASYSDTALTIPNPNPTVADSAGRFIQMFITDAKLYKIVLTDANDNTIYTADPVDPKVFSLNDFSPRPTSFWGVTSGTSAAYILTADPIVTEYSSTQTFFLQFHIACTASPTLTYVSGGSALNLKKSDGAGSKIDLEEDDVLTGTYEARNDGTDIIILNPEKPFFDSRNLSSANEDSPGVVERLTDSELAAGTDTTRYASAANLLSLFGASTQAAESTNRLPVNAGSAFSETIIKSGLSGATINGNASITVTFSAAFPNNCRWAMGVLKSDNNLGVTDAAVLVDTFSAAQIVFDRGTNGGAASHALQVYWMAIGD